MVLECCYLPGSLDVPKPLELLQLEFPRKWIYSSSRVDCNFSMASSAARKTLIMLSQCFTPHAICCLFNHDSIFSLASLSPPSFFFPSFLFVEVFFSMVEEGTAHNHWWWFPCMCAGFSASFWLLFSRRRGLECLVVGCLLLGKADEAVMGRDGSRNYFSYFPSIGCSLRWEPKETCCLLAN